MVHSRHPHLRSDLRNELPENWLCSKPRGTRTGGCGRMWPRARMPARRQVGLCRGRRRAMVCVRGVSVQCSKQFEQGAVQRLLGYRDTPRGESQTEKLLLDRRCYCPRWIEFTPKGPLYPGRMPGSACQPHGPCSGLALSIPKCYLDNNPLTSLKSNWQEFGKYLSNCCKYTI